MTPNEALRFLEHEARACRGRDNHEALCLLLPALLKIFQLKPMDDLTALDFRFELRQRLKDLHQ